MPASGVHRNGRPTRTGPVVGLVVSARADLHVPIKPAPRGGAIRKLHKHHRNAVLDHGVDRLGRGARFPQTQTRRLRRPFCPSVSGPAGMAARSRDPRPTDNGASWDPRHSDHRATARTPARRACLRSPGGSGAELFQVGAWRVPNWCTIPLCKPQVAAASRSAAARPTFSSDQISHGRLEIVDDLAIRPKCLRWPRNAAYSPIPPHHLAWSTNGITTRIFLRDFDQLVQRAETLLVELARTTTACTASPVSEPSPHLRRPVRPHHLPPI